MNHIKLFEAYFDEKEDTTWEEISYDQFTDFVKTHQSIKNHDYSDIFDIFDEAYNLYQKDGEDYNHNQYRIGKYWAYPIEFYLVPKKTDIFISAFEDDWYTISVCKYRDYSDDDYYSQDRYLADGIEGVNDWLTQF